MIKRLIYIMIAACILKISAYGNKATVPETSDPTYDFVQNIDNNALNEKETWSEQDVMSMFTEKKKRTGNIETAYYFRMVRVGV